MYTRTAAAAQLSQFSSTGDVVWNVQIAQTPNAVPVIAADGAITLALNNSLQVLEPSGAIRQNIAIQPMLASYTGLSILGVALGKDSTTMITVLANDKTALLAINAAGTKRWSYERQCGGIADTLASRSIRIALDGTVLTNLCSQVIAVTSSTLGLASTQWATVGRDNQNSSRIQGDGQNRRTIHIIGKLKNIYLPTHLFSNQKVVITDETNQVVCAVKSNLVGEYRCGFNTTNRNAMTWTAKTDDEYGFATQPFAVAAGEFNTRTEIEQDLLIPAKTLQLSGTLKLANGSLAIGKTVTFKLGASAPMETTSGNDGKYLFVTVFAKNQASITPELRFSDAGQDAVAKLLIELAPQGVTQATQDLQLGLQAGGSERWRVALNNNANMVLAPDGSLRVISQGVRAINLDGSLRWNVDNLSEGKLLVDHNGVTYVATNSQFIAYNPNGTIKYKVRNLPSSALGIAQTSDRGFVISYSNSYTIKVDANANEVWRYQLPTGSFTTSPITLADGNAVIGTDLGVMTISPTGALVSSLATPPVQRLIVNNSQVIASTGSTIRALQGTSQVWTFNANAANIQYLVADKDGIIYFSEANSIVALNQNGQLRWRKDIGTEVGSLAIGSDGIVHAITTNALLTLNPDSSIRWNTLISNQNLAIAPIIASDGTVFSTTLTQLLAHYTDSRGLDNSWARQGANNAGVNTLLSYTADNLPRTVKFRGLVSNQYIANSTLAGYTVSVKKADGKLLCRTQSDSTGMYECNSLLESDLTNVQYDIVGTLTSAQLTGVVPVGTLTIEQTKPLELPITTLKVEGVVEDIQQPAQPIANATVQIMLPTPTQSTLTNNNGSYGFYLAFADGTSQTQLQLSATFNANTVNKVINQNLTPHVLNTVNQKFVLDDRVIGAVARTVDLGAAQIGTPVIGGNNNIYVATTQGVRALRPDGGELWRYTIRIPSSQIRLLPDQSVVFSDGYRAIKLRADGSEDWVASGHSQVVAIGADQTIFTQATNGNIASLKPDGSLVWVSDVAGSANSVAITKDGTILSVNFLEVVALNPNGIRRWKKSINSYLYLPVISLSDSRIFIVNNDGNATMMALDYDGQFRWGTYQMDPGMKTSSAAIDQTGLVYFSQNGKLKIADQNGSIQAQVTVPDLQIKMPTIANDATVYALTNTGVVAVSSDQQIKWTYTGSGMPTSAIPVTGKSVLLSQGTKLLWINGNSTTLQPNAAWGHQSSDLAATRRLPSDGTQKRYAEFKGVINHAFIPSMKIANATVTVRANGVILCSANTSSTGVYRCAGPSDTLGSFTANIEVVSDYGVTSLSDTVAAAPVDTTTSIVNDIPINVSTVKLTGQIVDSAQNPVGNLNVRLLGIPANAIVSAEDGSAIARQWSSLDATYAHVVTANVGGQFNAWISLPVDVNATDFRVKVLNSDTGGVGNVGIQQAINQNQLNQINAVVTLQQTALKIRGQILKPNSQPYPNAKLSIMSPRPVQALDANGQPLGYNYRFDITTDSTGQYAITLNMVSEVTDPLEVTVEANITGNTVSRNVQATLLAGVTTEVIENITFDNAVIGVSSWNYDLDYSASRLAVGADRTVYATEKNFIHAINRDGSLKWKNEICAGCYGNNYYTLGTPVIRQDGVILVLAWRQYNQNASKLYAFNAAGTELWSYTLNSDTGTELALGSNSVVYVAVKNTNQVVAVGADGVELWRSKVEFASSYRSGKLLVAPDETIYFVSEDDAYYANAKIQAFNKNGTPRWQYPVNLALTGAAIATDGTLYVAGTQQLYSGPPSKKLLAITSSGKLRWEKDLFDSSNYHIIILPGEKVMVANVGLDNGTVFDNLGNTVQQITLDGYLVDNNGNVYGNISNSTKATSLANTTLWEFAKKGNGMVNGNLFVMRDQNQLYAVNIPTATLANTSWASVNKDQFNSSRSTPDAIVRRLVQIQGVVQTSPNNTPVSDAHVVIQFTNGDPFCNTTTDYDGNYTCAAPTDNFAAFDLQARVVQSSSGTGSQNVSVPTDAANSVTTLTSNLSVSRAQLRLQGIITDAAASPNPISGAVVSLRSNNVVNSNTTTDVNGVYSFLLDVNYATVEIEIQVHDQINTQKRVIIVSPPAGQLTERTENFQVDQTSTGTGRWAFNTNSGAELKTAAIAPSGEIYVGNDSGLLVSLTATGQERWRKTLQNVVSTPIISPSGTIYVSDSQNLYAFDNQGSQLWVESLGNDGVAQLAMMPSGAIITLTDHQIRKYSAIGQLQWTQPADYNYYAGNISPVITASNKILYCRNTLTMLNDDGSQAWQSSQNCASEIALSSTTAYVQNSGLVAVDLADGQTKWTYPTSSTTFTPLIDGQENITWVSRQGYLGYGYGSGEPPMITTVSASGTLLREATLPETNSVTGNMIYGTGSTLLVPRDGNVTALDQNLQPIWQYNYLQYGRVSGSNLTTQGLLLVGIQGKLLAINTGLTSILSTAPWAKAFGDMQNSGHN